MLRPDDDEAVEAGGNIAAVTATVSGNGILVTVTVDGNGGAVTVTVSGNDIVLMVTDDSVLADSIGSVAHVDTCESPITD